MPNFSFTGLKQGRYVDGVIEGLDMDEAVFKLREDKVTITGIKPITGDANKSSKSFSWNMEFGGTKIPNKDILLFTKVMATMITSGITVLDALNLASDQTKNKPLKKFIQEAVDAVNMGQNISTVFEKNKNFDEVEVSLIKAGETTGRLDSFFSKLNEMQQQSMDIKSKLKKAMIYPVTVLCIVFVVTIFMLIKVVPIFQEMYEGMGAQLPAPTLAVVSASEFVSDPLRGGLLLGIIIVAVISLKITMSKVPKVKRFIHGLYLRIPILGNILLKAKLSRFAMVMENLTVAGVGLIETLDIASGALGNLVLVESVNRIQRGVYSGEQIGTLFVKETVFPKIFTQLVSVGEQSGSLDAMFGSAAVYMNKEFSDIADNFNTILEPVIIVVMGVVVGGLLIALYTPMFNMGAMIQ